MRRQLQKASRLAFACGCVCVCVYACVCAFVCAFMCGVRGMYGERGVSGMHGVHGVACVRASCVFSPETRLFCYIEVVQERRLQSGFGVDFVPGVW